MARARHAAPPGRAGPDGRGNRAGEGRRRQAADERLRAALVGPACLAAPRWAVLRVTLAALRWFIRIREDTRFCRSQLYGLTRHIMGCLGTRLAADGRLREAGDVIHLTVAEILAAVAGPPDSTGPPDGTGLPGLVAQRRAELESWVKTPAPPPYLRMPPGTTTILSAASARAAGTNGRDPAVGGSAEPADGSAEPASGRVLNGLGSSGGIARARARVVLEPTAADGDRGDHILVARQTDPGWLYLIMAAKGIVVERGSLLSHTAITGRLLGIPAVVGIPNATTEIPDGCLIEVDGSAGTVRLLPGEEVSG